jgi:hypothetical protein
VKADAVIRSNPPQGPENGALKEMVLWEIGAALSPSVYRSATVVVSHKLTGPNLLAPNFSVSDAKSSSLAG